MYCKYCGATIEDGIKFCNICGAESSASSEKIKPTAAKSTMTRDKRDPREQYSANKLDAYYSYDNSILNNDNYNPEIHTTLNRNNYVQKKVHYTENIGGDGVPDNYHQGSRFPDVKKKMKVGTKIVILLLTVLVGVGVGILIQLMNK